ncbi:MAG: hypothetical protein EOM04_09185, partial [Clostridia bacterium]|nr:hypothetical protein [Clostridia bacterium]
MEQENVKKVPWGILESLAVFLIFLLLLYFAPEIKNLADFILGKVSFNLSLIEIFIIFSIFQFIIFVGYIILIVKGRYKVDLKIFFAKEYSPGEIIKYGLISS